MGISWAQGLLAGAAGVADYSNQEQARRQKRIDKTQSLKDQMETTRAKSQYAIEMEEYTKNRKLYKFLDSLDENDNFGMQFALLKDQGFSSLDAQKMANRNMKQTKLMKAPKRIDMPEFVVKAFEPSARAKAPIQEWLQNFIGEGNEDKKVPMPGPSPETFGTVDPTALETQRPMEQVVPETPQIPQATQEPQGSLGGGFEPENIFGTEAAVKTERIPMFNEAGEAVANIYEIKPNGNRVLKQTINKGSKAEIPKEAEEKARPKAKPINPQEVRNFYSGEGNVYDVMFKAADSAADGWFSGDNREEVKVKLSQSYLTKYNNLIRGRELYAEDVEGIADLELEAQGLALIETLTVDQMVGLLEDSSAQDIAVFENISPSMLAPVMEIIEDSTDHTGNVAKLEMFMDEQLGKPKDSEDSGDSNSNFDIPQVGQIVDGYRFKGGAPDDSNNWEKI